MKTHHRLKIRRLRRRLYFSFFENFGNEYAWHIAKKLSNKLSLIF